jgi:negative regulator of flagellin synthesis FlgM
MEIRNDAEALKAFLGVSSPSSARVQQSQTGHGAAPQASLAGDQATVSQIGIEVSQAVHSDVRSEKVAAVQQALAAGTYKIGADAVADKVIDAMLDGRIVSGK